MSSLFARRFRAASGTDPKHARRVARERLSTACVETLEPRQLMSTYYISPSGSDSASGTSTTSAWRSVSRVNSQTLHAGDSVLFQGGATFSGGLYVPSNEGGTSTNPVKFGSYGTGRATISSGSSRGIDVAQTAGVNISNLNFKGNGVNSSHGIHFHCDWSGKTLYNIKIDNVDVSGYGGYNIRIQCPSGSNSRFNDIRITNANLHDSKQGGLSITGSGHNANKNVYVGNVKAYNHAGTGSTSSVSGNGIFVADVDGAVIERCVSYNNGTNGAAPVGIWAAGSNRVTIQYCESYGNKTKTTTDGGGFDFDWDVTNSTMQYNYSHDNHGPGYILAAGTHVNDSNVLRYNVSQNDGRRNGRAGIQMWGNVKNAKIYNNVVYFSATGNDASSAFYAHNLGANNASMYNVEVRNNIFVTTGGAKLVKIQGGFSGSTTNHMVGNAYYSSGSSFRIDWNGSILGSIDSYRSSKGQERYNGVNVGFQGDPKLQGAGQGTAINNAYNLGSLWQYKLQAASPLINKGLVQPTTLSGASKDFFGGTLPKSGLYDIGVHEAA